MGSKIGLRNWQFWHWSVFAAVADEGFALSVVPGIFTLMAPVVLPVNVVRFGEIRGGSTGGATTAR